MIILNDKCETKEAKYWNKRASMPGYTGVVNEDKDQSNTRSINSFIVDNIDLRDKIVLDLGCGMGRIFPSLIQGGVREIHGIDISHDMLRLIEFRYPVSNPKINLYCTNISNTYNVVTRKNFDVIFSINTLSCIEDDELFVRTIGQLNRLLQKGSVVFVLEPMSINKIIYYKELMLFIRPIEFYRSLFISCDCYELFNQRVLFGSYEFSDSSRHLLIYTKTK